MMSRQVHCVKSVQIRRFSGPYFFIFSPNKGKYRPEKTSYLDIFQDEWVKMSLRRFVLYLLLYLLICQQYLHKTKNNIYPIFCQRTLSPLPEKTLRSFDVFRRQRKEMERSPKNRLKGFIYFCKNSYPRYPAILNPLLILL